MSSPRHRHDAMKNSPSNTQFARVFVVLDVTCDHAPALQSGAQLASRLDAPLVAVLVEHGQLEQLEKHPLARTIELPTGLDRAGTTGSLKSSWRAMANRIQGRLNHLSRRFRVDSDFQVIQGDVRAQLEKRTDSSDLLVVESCGRAVTRHVRIQSRGHAMGRRLGGSVVFVGARPARVRSLAVVYDGSELGRRGIDTALRLAGHGPTMLTLLPVATSAGEAEQLQQQAAALLKERGVRIRPHIRRITCCNTDEIVRVAHNVHANFVIVPGNDEYPADDDIDELTRTLDAPVLVMRDNQQSDEEAA